MCQISMIPALCIHEKKLDFVQKTLGFVVDQRSCEPVYGIFYRKKKKN